MADTSLKSLTFPGLPNRYIILQIDNTLSQSGYAADAKETGDALNKHEEALETKAEIDGYYEEMTVGDAEQLVATQYIEDSVPYLYRTSGGSADIGNREYDSIVGGSVVWNQLVNGASVTVPSGHKYLLKKGTAWSIGASTGTAITGLTSGTDMIFDLTAMFGTTIADYIYSLEQATAGAGVAWFKKLFPDNYYEYNAGELMHVGGLSAHQMVGFNQYNPTTGTAKVIGGMQYQITGTYTAISMGGTVITPDSNGLFTPTANGTLTVTGGNDSTTCIHLVRSGTRNGEYEPYVKHTYALDDSLTLRGVPKLDSSNNIYWDGDTYESDGTVTRRYGFVDLGTLKWIADGDTGSVYESLFRAVGIPSQNPSLVGIMKFNGELLCPKYVKPTAYSNIPSEGQIQVTNSQTLPLLRIKDSSYTSASAFKTAMSGVYLVYELATPTIEEATPYNEVQIVDDWGTEEYVSTGIVPVGHNTRYPQNLRDKLQHLPNLADSDGFYLIQQTGTQMDLVVFHIPKATGLADGTYTLKATVSGGTPTYTWESEV